MTARAILNRASSEDDLLTAIMDATGFLGYQRAHYRRSDKAILQGDPGLPDVIACRRGVLWFIEAKSQTGRLSEAQWRWRHELPLDSHWFRYREVRPADLDAIIEELTRG